MVDHRQRAAPGGSLAAEGEDIQVVVFPFDQAIKLVASGDIRDARTVIALQRLALRKVSRLLD